MASARRGLLEAKTTAALSELGRCRACPRECLVDRLADDRSGVCGVGRRAIVASAFPHFGEEDCLRGWNGSGTIFFSLCNLRCQFCQNWDISQRRAGREMDASELASLALELQEAGCHNINLVTPEHVVPQVVEMLSLLAERGLRVPVVYNTSAYDSVESLRLLDGLVDVYMPDFKFWKSETARRLARAADYPERARAAIAEMQQDTYVNLMGQYRPEYKVGERLSDGRIRLADVARRPTDQELFQARRLALEAGLWRLDRRW